MRPGQKEGVVKASGATIIPVTKQKPHQLIVEAIYRYPIGEYVLELPSGLIDSTDSSLAEACTRELKEETGYVGQPMEKDPKTPSVLIDPWKSLEADGMLLYEIDMELEANKAPQQELESEEKILVYLVDLANLQEELLKFKEEKGYQIGEKIWSLAVGIKLTKLFDL